jgi:YggT family protein
VSTFFWLLSLVLWLFLALMFVRFVVDWVQVFARSWTPTGPILVILEIVYSITDPPIMFFRRFIPPLRLGSVALDLSFMIVLVIAYLLLILLRGLAAGSAA